MGGRATVSCGRICEELRRLAGLSGYEARAYLALLRGARRPREVAEEAGIPVQRVYDVLSRLQRRGLAVRAGDDWAPVPPREALAREAMRLLEEARERAARLQRLSEELEDYAEATGDYVVVVRGAAESIAAALEALERCRGGPVYVTAYKAAEKATELMDRLEPLIAALSSAAGGARILYYSGASVPREALELVSSAPGLEARASPEALLDMLVACDTVVIGVPWGGDVATVVVKSRAFASGLRRRLEEAWLRAGKRATQYRGAAGETHPGGGLHEQR